MRVLEDKILQELDCIATISVYTELNEQLNGESASLELDEDKINQLPLHTLIVLKDTIEELQQTKIIKPLNPYRGLWGVRKYIINARIRELHKKGVR